MQELQENNCMHKELIISQNSQSNDLELRECEYAIMHAYSVEYRYLEVKALVEALSKKGIVDLILGLTNKIKTFEDHVNDQIIRPLLDFSKSAESFKSNTSLISNPKFTHSDNVNETSIFDMESVCAILSDTLTITNNLFEHYKYFGRTSTASSECSCYACSSEGSVKVANLFTH